MTTENKMGMTLHEADTFRNMLDNYFEDRTYRVAGGTVENAVTLRTLMAYVDNLLAAKEAEIERLKARDARFIQHCDSLSAILKDLANHHLSNNTSSVIVKIQMEHEVDLAPIFNPELAWYRFSSPDQILEKWLNAYISEGLAADLLGVGRIEARMMMENKYGLDWRSAREICAELRSEEEENNQSG